MQLSVQPNGLSSPLNTEEEAEFREWARDNYDAQDGIAQSVHHDVVRDEFNIIKEERTNSLRRLAHHSFNGACNPCALIQGLAHDTKGWSQNELRDSVEVKIILGQISFLLGESAGPSPATFAAYADQQAQSSSRKS